MAINHAALVGRIRVAQGKDLLRRGFKVQARARVLLSGSGGAHPRRVRTGQLRSSVQVELRSVGGSPLVRIGTGVKHARWVHDGTGIYGPRRRPITPKTSKVLAFTSASGDKVFVRSVRGMRRNQFLKDALPAAKD